MVFFDGHNSPDPTPGRPGIWETILVPNLCAPPVNDFSDDEEVNPAPLVPEESLREQFWNTRRVGRIDRPEQPNVYASHDTLQRSHHYETRKRFVAQCIVSILESPYRNMLLHWEEDQGRVVTPLCSQGVSVQL